MEKQKDDLAIKAGEVTLLNTKTTDLQTQLRQKEDDQL